jgi:hypothetical protein
VWQPPGVEINGGQAAKPGAFHAQCETAAPAEEVNERRRHPSLCGDTLPRMKAALAETEIVTSKGKRFFGIIPIKDYRERLELVEDTGDMAWLKRARRNPLYCLSARNN